MSAGFTPGPWGCYWSDGEVELYADRAGLPALEEFYIYIDGENMGRHPLSEANARLIAAAPDLFNALAAMVADHEAIQCNPWPSFDAARAALAKARGEQ